MFEKLKNIAGFGFGIAIFLGLLVLPFIFIKGAFWASQNILPPLILLGWIALALVLFIFLPLSIFGRWRAFTGTAIFAFSYIFLIRNLPQPAGAGPTSAEISGPARQISADFTETASALALQWLISRNR